MIRRVTVVGAVLVLTATTALTGLGAATAAPAAPVSAGPTITADALPPGETGTVVYRIEVADLDRTSQFSLIVGDAATVTEHRGFERRSAGSGTRFVPSDERTHGTVVVEVPTGSSANGGLPIGTERWSLAKVPYAAAQWTASGGGETHHVRPLGDAFGALEDTETATYGDRYALVGSQTTTTVEARGQRVDIVRPSGTAFGAGSAAVAATLTAASDDFTVGDRDDALTLFALPEPARAGGESFPARDEAWINADSAVNSPNNVWIHEYVHTRQAFRLSEDMTWFREASAEYYAARLTHEQGRISERAMTAHLDGDGVAAPLTDPDAWASERVPYTKGARVLALLDRNIRQTTDGERTLQDVFRKMNGHGGPVTYAEFKRMVETTAGHSMDGWLDRYVAGEHAIASAYEPRPIRSGVLGLVGAIQQGDTSIITTLVVSVVSGAAISLPLLAVLNRLRRRFERPDRRPEPGG
jgi:hypothetical protein